MTVPTRMRKPRLNSRLFEKRTTNSTPPTNTDDLIRKLNRCIMISRAQIGLSFDGQTFNDPDLESFLGRLLELRAVGYSVPDFVFEAVREDIAEEAAGTPPEHGGLRADT